MTKNVEVELANISKTYWVTLNKVDYTAISSYDENSASNTFEVYRTDDKNITEKEKEEVSKAITEYSQKEE